MTGNKKNDDKEKNIIQKNKSEEDMQKKFNNNLRKTKEILNRNKQEKEEGEER